MKNLKKVILICLIVIAVVVTFALVSRRNEIKNILKQENNSELQQAKMDENNEFQPNQTDGKNETPFNKGNDASGMPEHTEDTNEESEELSETEYGFSNEIIFAEDAPLEDVEDNDAEPSIVDNSTYTVEYTYNEKQYVMEGGTTIPMKDVLDYLELYGEVEEYEVSDEDLFAVIEKDGELHLQSKVPFDTEEWIDVTINGEKYHIIVTDENIYSNRTIDGTWVFKLDTDTGTLTIQVANGLTEGGLVNGYKNESDWKNIWKKAYNDSTDIRPLVEHIVFKPNDVGTKFDFNSKTTAYMFMNFTNLVDIDFSGVKEDSMVAETIRGMFQNCKNLKSIDLSWMATKEDSLQNMQDLFNGCENLETVILNNPKFVTRKSTMQDDGSVTAGAAQMGRMFKGCGNLKTIDMSNITLYGRDGNWTQIAGTTFNGTDLKAIQTIKMDNIKLPNHKDLKNVFAGLTTLTTFSMKSTNPGDIAPQVEFMTEMFGGSFTSPLATETATLDLSGLGKLDNIINMDGLIKDCTGLESLIIDNLDNSNIGSTNGRHTLLETTNPNYITQAEGKKVGAKEYGRELFGKGIYNIAEIFTKLKTISAKNANVWMCKDGRGVPGSEYWLAANDSDVLYFTNRKMEFAGDNGNATINSKRDYIDLIIDRDGVNKHTLIPNSDTLPDASTNINIAGGDLNRLGDDTFRPGKLAPGVYTISSESWEEDKIRPMGSYYRISYIGLTDYYINPTANTEIEITPVDGAHYINTKNKSHSDWGTGDYVIDCSGEKAIRITFTKAGQDIEGRLYDIDVTINKITFKNVDAIPLYEERGAHNSNKYIDRNVNNAGGITDPDGTYYRTILWASKRNGIQFRNYVRVGDPGKFTGGEDANSYKALSGGSGTDIDFTISFRPADGNDEEIKDNKTFVFFVDDLDVPATQDWDYPVENDPCYDILTIDKAKYGIGGEAFVLRDGNYVNTVKFADHTGLRVVNDTVVTTGSDPSTSWSEFAVTANPKKAEYTWTSGIACDSYALRNTIPPRNEIKIIKRWNDRGSANSPRPEDLTFEINYKKDGVDKKVTIPSTATWNKDDTEFVSIWNAAHPNDQITTDDVWTMTFLDEDNLYQPAGGYEVTETGPDKSGTVIGKYDIVTETAHLEYNEVSGYFEAVLENKEQTKDVVVTKRWIDTESQRARRPAKIKLQLKAGTEIVAEYILDITEASTYTYTFIGLPKFDKEKNEISYSVDEAEVNPGDLRFYEKTVSPDGLELTNTYKPIPTKVIAKYVDSETGEELLEPVEIPGNVDDTYNTEQKEIPLYKFKNVSGETYGKMTEEEIVVTYLYEKAKFNVKVEKIISAITIDGNRREINGKLGKVEINKDKLDSTNVEIEYKIIITNSGDISGEADVKDYIPDGLMMLADKNAGWEIGSGFATSKTRLLNPGESQELKITMKWINGESHIGTKNSKVEVTGRNALGMEEFTVTDNSDDITIIIAIATGTGIKVIAVLIGVILIVIAKKVILTKNRKENK